MPAVQYPFIDIAVHPRIRERFARGEAMALFSLDLDRVLWANGAGADLFGYSAIYDFIEQGAKAGDVSFRQVASTARQLAAVGDTRGFLIRIAAGFQRVVVNATVEMVSIQAGERAILFSCPVSASEPDTHDRAQRMLEGFDDPDTHMAVLGRDGEVIAASAAFKALGITPQTASMLVTMAGSQPERLIKRPIPTGQGYLPAAIGKLSEDPALHLLFVVEMVIGHLDPVEHAAPAAVVAPVVVEPELSDPEPATPGHQWTAEEVSAIHPMEAASQASQPDTMAAITAESLPPEADAPIAEQMSHPEPQPGLQSFEEPQAETVAAISAADLPAEPDAIDQPIGLGVEGEIPVGDTSVAATESQYPASADLTLPVSADDWQPDWATSDIPPVTIGEIAGDRHDDSVEDAHGPAESAAVHPENPAFDAVIDAVSEIEDVEDAPETIDEDPQQAPVAGEQPAEGGDIFPAAEDLPQEDDLVAQPLADVSADEPVDTQAAVEVEASDVALDADELVRQETGDEEIPAVVEDVPAAQEPVYYDVAELIGEQGAEHAIPEPAAASLDDVVSPATGSGEAAPAGNTPGGAFVFNRHGRATRFVWKIDAEGRFSEISREFAEAVGPHATSVIGVAFTDIAALFNLDPDGKISELLAKRDTWSGRTIHWPVEGTTLTVPVDLAALPTYTRSREFDGFRGFGVVRLSDAAEDPLKVGLTLTGEAKAAAAEELTTSEAEDVISPADQPDAVADLPDRQGDAVSIEAIEPAHADVEEPSALKEEPQPEEIEEPELPFKSEPPALRIVETPARRLSDKIIQLHEHRIALGGDSLSPSEQAAFREIGKQLQPFGKRAEPPSEPVEQAEPTAFDTAQTEIPDEDGASDSETTPEANDIEEARHNPAPALAAETADASRDGDEFDPLAVLNTAIPPRSKMTDGLSAAVVDQLPVAILVHAGDMLIHANPEFLRLTGYESLVEIEGIGGLDALLQRHDLQEKTDRPGTMVVVRSDDTLVPVTARLQSIRWEDTSALMLALMPVEKEGEANEADGGLESRDEIRPERMLEKVAKLQVEVEELRSILETATDGVAIIGPEGDIRSMNRSASALFNYDEQETRGKPFVMLFAHESQKAVLDYLNGLSGNGVASLLNDGREVIGREASGGFVPLFMTMGTLTSSNGYCAVIRDITQWKRTEEELRNAKRAAETANAHKTDFLARVSHEIRTPLNAIVGFSDMMASERLGPIGHPRYVEYASDIGRSGRHVLDIVNDLLDISKIEAGEMDLEFGSVGLNAAISEAVSIVQPQANGQRVIIRTALSQAVPNVVADLRSIKQIALNILSNAIRFTPSGGQIVVSTSYEGNGSVVMRIRDTGVGMTRTELEHAMKPFRQVSTNTRQRGDGTGLGLPLTKAMVDANRAVFAIHSAPNEGTLVEVTFPSPRVLAT